MSLIPLRRGAATRFAVFAVMALLIAALGACTMVPSLGAPDATSTAAAPVAVAPPTGEAQRTAESGATAAATPTAPAVAQATNTAAPTSALPGPTTAPVAPAAVTEPAPATAQVQPIPTSTAGPTAAPTAMPVEPALPAPVCTPGETTPAQTEGPYFKEGAPQRNSLLDPGIEGTVLMLTGYVLNAECEPLPGARIDFWQAGDDGGYDNQGYDLRGYQITDENGRYWLETVVPGLYTGRTRHLHLRIEAPGSRPLVSQLYFAGENANQSDRIFDPRLVLDLQDGDGGVTAGFDFVVPTR